MDDPHDTAALWPAPPELRSPVITTQRWTGVVFLHWRIPEKVAARYMPPGVTPDTFDGASWLGLIGFQMKNAGIGLSPGIPYFGSFNEVNVRLYSREADGTRGVVFLSLDANRLPVVLAARTAGVPYVWSWISQYRLASQSVGGAGTGYTVRRFRREASSRFSVFPRTSASAVDPLSIYLTARFGMHGRFRGRTIYVPNSHEPWPLYPAELADLSDGLVAAAGITVSGPPESILFSPGVHAQFGLPRLVPSGG